MAARGIYNVVYMGPFVNFVAKDNANYQFSELPMNMNTWACHWSFPQPIPVAHQIKIRILKIKVLHINGEETFCWSSNYVTSTESSILYCSKEQFIQNWVRCNPEVKKWQVGRQRVVISNTVIGLWKGWCWGVATRFSCTKHAHMVCADKFSSSFTPV